MAAFGAVINATRAEELPIDIFRALNIFGALHAERGCRAAAEPTLDHRWIIARQQPHRTALCLWRGHSAVGALIEMLDTGDTFTNRTLCQYS